MSFIKTFLGLEKPSKVEKEWQETANRRLLPIMKIAVPTGAIFYLFYSLWDYIVAPEIFQELFLIRICGTLILLSLVLGLIVFGNVEKISSYILSTGIVTLTAVTCWVLIAIEDGFAKGLPGVMLPFLALILIPFPRILVVTSIMCTSIVLGSMHFSGVSTHEFMRMAPFVITMMFCGIIFGYVLIASNKKTFMLQKSLYDAKLEAEQADRAKSSFLATMSHEVRTPLNGVLGIVNLLEDTPLNSKQHRHLETIRYSGETLLTILNDILDFSKLDAGKLNVEYIELDLLKLVESVVELMQSRASEKGLLIQSYVDVDVPQYIESDPTRLRQVLINLISNAIKFSERGTIDVHIKNIHEDGYDATLRFEIKDQGIGITEDAQKALFKEFTQADASTSRKYGGTGLGLSICQRIVHLLGGEIGATSKEGEGSTFWFNVPVKTSDYDPLLDGDSLDQSSTYVVTEPMNILLAEDNKVNQEVALGYLEKLNHKVTLAENGAIAYDLVQKHDFDLILMDMQMPIMDGLEATKKIKELGNEKSETPVIALTANALKGDDERCLAAGMIDHVGKPINANELYNAIARHAPAHLQKEQSTATNKKTKSAAAKDETETRLDLSHLNELDKLFGREYTENFINENIPELLRHLQEIQDAKANMEQVFLLSHNIKSMSSMFGLVEISVIAEAIEIASNAEREEEVEELIVRLEANFEENMEELQKVYPKETAA